jgi:hypothetical protein
MLRPNTTVFTFDADSKDGINEQPLWTKKFVDPAAGVFTVLSEDVHCRDIYPEIGITGTPVIDQASGTLYVVTKEKHRGHSFVQRLHALDVSTGRNNSAVRWRSPQPWRVRAMVRWQDKSPLIP